MEVFGGIATTEAGMIDLEPSCDPLCTVVRREEFDAMLVRHAQAAGLEVINQTRVLGVEQRGNGVRVATERGLLDAQMLVGADGSGSRVRNAVFGRTRHNIGRALVLELPVREACAEEFIRRRYRFDFTCVATGVSGYSWSFPCLIRGSPYLNVGIYDQNPRKARAGNSSAICWLSCARHFRKLNRPCAQISSR